MLKRTLGLWIPCSIIGLFGGCSNDDVGALGTPEMPAMPEPGNGTPDDDPGPERTPPTGDFLTDTPPASVDVTLAEPELGPLRQSLDSAFATSAAALSAAHAVPHLTALSYDPTTAEGLELIDASALAPDSAERAVLAQRGFVISRRQEFPSFAYGYASIYSADLPVFISADMLLEAVHRSYDAILVLLERSVLRSELASLLTSMRRRLASGEVELAPNVAADADIFLSVAQGLYLGRESSPHDPALQARARELYRAAMNLGGAVEVELFGEPRVIDASQFEPRGHYAGEMELETYFRAMMWLGRTDFRLLETLADGQQVYRPRQLQAAFALDALMDAEAKASWQRLDRTIGLFVGEHDEMTPPELGELLQALGVDSVDALSGMPESRVADAIARGHFGEQRIASRILERNVGAGTFPLDASFAFFGQRYTVDSHVFSNLVYDRVGGGAVPRVVPNPLDVAFAALGNDQAVLELAPELARFDYAGDLQAMRVLVDAHPESYWQSSLYTSWLAALRSLSPTNAGTALDEPGLPEVARTAAWGERLLNTQLASWAELRHDTLLYAKQSYTLSNACEFPDAYVDPYPEFFHAIARFAEQGAAALQELSDLYASDGAPSFAMNYFQGLGDVASRLAEMAEFQRTGMPHTQEQLDFINNAVQLERNCDGTDILSGWYAQLFFDGDGLDFDPTIADVHTDPGGVAPPREPSVLHVATGNPRLMLMTRETCAGPRAYAGIVFSYFEHLADGYDRLDDEAWRGRLESGTPPPDVAWLANALPPAAP